LDKLSKADKEFLLKTTTTLRIEFRLILKVENLQGLMSLRRLFLDNNLIERISGLDQLVHLEWLDLSFNKIRKIEGTRKQIPKCLVIISSIHS
jgi:Leucine-rich repeat (LRR) protein